MTGDSLLRLGSRSSPLARAQAEWIASQLAVCPALVWVKSEGDQDRTTELNQFGGQGVFTAALHQALFDDRVDAAVHSLKDLPAGDEEGITLCCVPVREDQRDVLVARDRLTLETLPEGAKIGTGSPRRAVLLRVLRSDIEVRDIRGNVDTRIRKTEEGEYDAVVLAAAGLERLGWLERASQIFEPEEMLPAVGQAALALQVRSDDAEAIDLVRVLDDRETRVAVTAERAFERRLGGGCHAPIAAYGVVGYGPSPERAPLRLRALVGGEGRILRGEMEGPAGDADALGVRLAEYLIAQGAEALLEAAT